MLINNSTFKIGDDFTIKIFHNNDENKSAIIFKGIGKHELSDGIIRHVISFKYGWL